LWVLDGKSAESFPVAEVEKGSYLIDWRQLRRFELDESLLPPDSIVRYREPSIWDLYKWRILGGIFLCIVEALLIIGLLLQRLKRRRAEGRFLRAVEAAPNGMLMVGKEGHILLANAQMEKLFGYRQEEMLGQPVEMLVPERFRAQHPAHRNRFFTFPAVRPMGAGRDLFGRRKDGSEFPVEIGLSPIQTEKGLFVLASIIDLTERKRAQEGLRRSHEQLRTLASQLLQAQEMERRRLAREMHDDLTQRLAVLAIEAGKLEHQLGLNGPVSESLTDMRVKLVKLSEDVHTLSRQLHPSILDDLGLIDAFRSECLGFQQREGIVVDYRAEDVPAALPKDVALGLYRITQEAQRNIAKHARTKQARVTLAGNGNELLLTVNDQGQGFDSEGARHRPGLGLASMDERTRLIGAELSVQSKPGQGTTISLLVSLEGDKP
jgi:PAS domain S-box-containing protein